MSLPETIWWCVPHNTCGSSYGCQFGREDDCRMVEVELHPVGTRAEIARTRAFFDPDGEEADDVEVV